LASSGEHGISFGEGCYIKLVGGRFCANGLLGETDAAASCRLQRPDNTGTPVVAGAPDVGTLAQRSTATCPLDRDEFRAFADRFEVVASALAGTSQPAPRLRLRSSILSSPCARKCIGNWPDRCSRPGIRRVDEGPLDSEEGHCKTRSPCGWTNCGSKSLKRIESSACSRCRARGRPWSSTRPSRQHGRWYRSSAGFRG